MEKYDDDELRSYGGLGAEYDKMVDIENNRKLMRMQHAFIKDSRKSSKKLFKLTIVGIVIASLTLIVSVIGWFI